MGRSDNQLRDARRKLFDGFPWNPTANDSIRFQELVADEILRSEAEQDSGKTETQKEHLHAVRIYADALAHALLSRYAIRQLSRNTGKPPHLTGQRKAFQLALDCAEALASHGVPPLLADLTNVLRNGDLIACVDPDLPGLLECKLSAVKHARFERQGRRGRQLARLESISAFLRCGRGRIHGEASERYTIEVTRVPRFSYATIDEIVGSALQHRPVVMTPSPDELYSAAMYGEAADMSPAMVRFQGKRGDHVAVGSSLDPLRSGVWDVPPPILWDINVEGRWALMEGDVAISHAVRAEALVGLARDNLRVASIVRLPGKVPWGYEILVGDEPLTLTAKVVLDVVYCHHTIESAGDMLLEQAERAASLP